LVGVVAARPQSASAKSDANARSKVTNASHRVHRKPAQSGGKHASRHRKHAHRKPATQVSKSAKRDHVRHAAFNGRKPSRRNVKSSSFRSASGSKAAGARARRWWKPAQNGRRTAGRKQPANAVKPPTGTTSVKKTS
jgi:hypothetical protein